MRTTYSKLVVSKEYKFINGCIFGINDRLYLDSLNALTSASTFHTFNNFTQKPLLCEKLQLFAAYNQFNSECLLQFIVSLLLAVVDRKFYCIERKYTVWFVIYDDWRIVGSIFKMRAK